MATFYKEDECPLCRSELYLNPNMKLIQAICGHKFCETCINRSLISNVPITCPKCNSVLKGKQNFMLNPRSDEDPEVEKELQIRKSILKDFNKRKEDFKTTRAYNDYLELVEDLIYNLANNIDVEATQERIRKYKKENQELIIINQSKRAEEERELQERLRVEAEEKLEKRQKMEQEEQMQLQQRLKEREELIERLATGKQTTAQLKKTSARRPTTSKFVNSVMNVTAAEITALASTPQPPPPTQAGGKQPPVAPSQPQPQGPTYSYQPKQPAATAAAPTTTLPVQQPAGAQAPQPPQVFVLPQPLQQQPMEAATGAVDEKKRAALALKAGGWKDEYVKQRTLEEAFTGLLLD